MATSKPFVSPSFSYETLEETLDVKPKGEELYIGIPKETSFNENRIALTPEGVNVLGAVNVPAEVVAAALVKIPLTVPSNVPP